MSNKNKSPLKTAGAVGGSAAASAAAHIPTGFLGHEPRWRGNQ